MDFEPKAGSGFGIGVAALVGLALADVLFIVLLSLSGVSPLGVLWLVLILLSLPLIALIGYRLYGLRGGKYFLSQNALTVTWGDVHEVIPMGEIEAVTSANVCEETLLPGGLWWPGCYVGRAKSETFGPLVFFATAPQEEQLIVRLSAGAYVISPADCEGFLAHFNTVREEGITEPVAYITRRWPIHDWEVWQSRWAWALMLTPLVLALALFAYVTVQASFGPAELPLRFDAMRLPTDFGPSSRLVLLPIIAGLVWLLDTVFGLAVHVQMNDRLAAYAVWGGGVLVQLALWFAAISLVVS